MWISEPQMGGQAHRCVAKNAAIVSSILADKGRRVGIMASSGLFDQMYKTEVAAKISLGRSNHFASAHRTHSHNAITFNSFLLSLSQSSFSENEIFS